MKFQVSSFLAVLHATAALAAPQVNLNPQAKETTLLPLGDDGYPRQAYLYKQVTDPISCGATGRKCSIGKTETKSVTVGVSGGITTPWTNVGLSISQTYATGQTANCDSSGEEGVVENAHTVCVWARIAHTGVKVQAWKHWPNVEAEKGDKDGEPDWMWSPNSKDGHGFVCAHDDECQSVDDEWWGYMSEGDNLWNAVSNKGGPQDFVWAADMPESRWN